MEASGFVLYQLAYWRGGRIGSEDARGLKGEATVLTLNVGCCYVLEGILHEMKVNWVIS